MKVLNKIKNDLNIYRRYPYWKKQGAIFIHVPKVAGTSINKALYGRTLGHYTASEIQKKFPGLFNDCFVFSLVRNPWDRVLSAYKFAKVGKTESMGVRMPEQYQIPEFNSFERFVMEWLKYKDVNQLDFIFQPQSLFLLNKDGNLLVDYLGRIENMSDVECKVSVELGRSIVFGHSNKTENDKKYHDYYSSQEMVDVVGNKYKSDIVNFNYDFIYEVK